MARYDFDAMRRQRAITEEDPDLEHRLRLKVARKMRALDAQRSEGFPVGTDVVIRMDDGKLVHSRVKYAPWQLGHGQWVVGIEGMAGGIRLDRVQRREE
jgi:hypothetical protein